MSEELPVKLNTKKKKRRLSSREFMLEMAYQKQNVVGTDVSNDDEVVNVSLLNPMHNLKRKDAEKGGGGGKNHRAKRLSKVMKTMKEKKIEVLKDEVSGRRYSHNMLTGITRWIDGEEENETVEEIQVLVDEVSGRKYSHNLKTGETKWL